MAYVCDPIEKLVLVKQQSTSKKNVTSMSSILEPTIWSVDILFWQMPIDHNLDVRFRPKQHVVLHSVIIIAVLIMYPQAIRLAIFIMIMIKAIHMWIWVSMGLCLVALWTVGALLWMHFYIFIFASYERIKKYEKESWYSFPCLSNFWFSRELLFSDLMGKHQGLKSEENLLLYQHMYMMTLMKMVFIF